jgi:hypothetical protein
LRCNGEAWRRFCGATVHRVRGMTAQSCKVAPGWRCQGVPRTTCHGAAWSWCIVATLNLGRGSPLQRRSAAAGQRDGGFPPRPPSASPSPRGGGDGRGEGDSPAGGQGGIDAPAAKRPPLEPMFAGPHPPKSNGGRAEQKPTTAGAERPPSASHGRSGVNGASLRAAGATVAASDLDRWGRRQALTPSHHVFFTPFLDLPRIADGRGGILSAADGRSRSASARRSRARRIESCSVFSSTSRGGSSVK